jgi:phospholipid-binding lipoprotein MlaA
VAALWLLVGCATSQTAALAPAPAPAGEIAPEPNAPPDRDPVAAPTVGSPTAAVEDEDPFEGFNRAMYQFNDVFDRYVGRPVAKAYRWVLPTPVRRGLGNFFNNLREPIVIVNDLLQGKPVQAAQDTGRFVTNTVIGLLGLFDPAEHLGMPRHDEDFGQTLGVWGAGEGPYFVWPFLGPRYMRDSIGWVADWQLWTPNLLEDVSTGQRNTLAVWNFIDTRAGLLDATDILDQAAGQDPYAFVREAYKQRRRHLIHDGKLPQESDIESLLFEDDPKAPPPGTPPAIPAP